MDWVLLEPHKPAAMHCLLLLLFWYSWAAASFVVRVQEEELEQAAVTAAAETDAKLVEEMQQREESLSSALLEARASLSNMQRLHQASQNQLFTIQSQTEEQQVDTAHTTQHPTLFKKAFYKSLAWYMATP